MNELKQKKNFPKLKFWPKKTSLLKEILNFLNENSVEETKNTVKFIEEYFINFEKEFLDEMKKIRKQVLN
jgi:hypothetical protein